MLSPEARQEEAEPGSEPRLSGLKAHTIGHSVSPPPQGSKPLSWSLHAHVRNSVFRNCQKVATTQVSLRGGMDGQNVAYPYSDVLVIL